MAGQSQRDIRRRIKSIKSMQQVTRAMQLVSAAKLRRAQARAVSSRPFASKLREVLARLAKVEETNLNHPLLQQRQVKRVAYLLVTADRGLAGGYNSNIIRRTVDILRDEANPYDLFVVGRRGRDYFRKRNYKLAGEYVNLGDDIDWSDAKDIARQLMDEYTKEQADAIYLVYTEFVNTITYRPVVKQLLPVLSLHEAAAGDASAKNGEGEPAVSAVQDKAEKGVEVEEVDYIWDPSPAAVLHLLLPRYVETLVYGALSEAKASEHGARMTAMRSATDNAEEMIEALTLSYNRARQAGITREITEIVGGANALTGGE